MNLINTKLTRQVASVTIFVMFAMATAMAQTTAARPDRGVMPNGSYSVSDIENISLSNGNVNLKIPLASLPPIAGGKLSWTINAHYNSKIWDLVRTELTGERSDLSEVNYVVDSPQLSDVGGWRISGQYEIEIRDARSDFDYQLPAVADEPDYTLMNNYNWYRVVLRMPDGAEHELRPADYGSFSGGKSFMYGYYRDTPYIHGAMRYYSFDGSYLYANVTSQSNWTVTLPDGTKVVQTTDGIQRIQDTNGNKIKIFTDTGGTHYQDEQTGREIRYLYDAAGNGGKGQGRVYYKTVNNNEFHIAINFDLSTVQGQVYKVKDWVPGQFGTVPCTRHNELYAENTVIRDIVLPQTESSVTRKFTFTYDSDTTESASSLNVKFNCGDTPQTYVRTASKGWGFISRIETPTGATIDYKFGLNTTHLPLDTDDLAKVSITEKKLPHDGTIDIWGYSITDSVSTLTNPDNSTVTESKYDRLIHMGSAYGKSGVSYRTVRPFMKTERHWTHLVFSGGNRSSPNGDVDFNGVVDFEYTTLTDGSGNNLKMSAKGFQYDYNGNVVQTTDYDWFDPALVSRDAQGVPTGVPGSAVVLRTVNNSHYNPATGTTSANVYAKRSLSTGTPLILNASQQTTVGPAITQLSYDGQGYGTAPTVGNLTSQSVWDDLDSKWITSSQTYGTYGNLATKTDPRGKVTEFHYDDSTHALPNRVVVDPQNSTGTQTTTTGYDYYSGLVTSQQDANNAISTIEYTNPLAPGGVDPFGRPGITYGPTVASQRHRVTMTYLDNARQVIQASDLNTENDQLLKTKTTSDRLGRVIKTEHTEDGTNYSISALKVYEQMGKTTYSSNPTRGSGASTNGWTRATTDTAGRIVEVATFSGDNKPNATGYTNSTGYVTTAYDAQFTTVTDQVGKVRRSRVNAVGQLTRVDEPNPSNSLGTVGVPSQATSYGYSVLGNLLTVTQGAQTRTFTYDSLSRLRTAVNPESGTITYVYDDNGNLTRKTDARGVYVDYVYDSLNRVTSRAYSDSTPAVTHSYESASVSNSKGRLTSASSSISATNTTAFDAQGKIVSGNQVTDGQTYSLSYGYNLAGGMTSLTYPSGRVIETRYDAAGRTAGVKDQQSGTYYAGAVESDATNRVQYEPHGAVKVMKLGNGLWEHTNFNSRMQPTEIGLGTSGTNSSTVGLTYNYGTSSNNGNLQSVAYAGGGLSYTQSFGYDELNRLTTSAESGTSWSQTNKYDPYGNRWIDLGGGNQSLYFNTANRITNSGYVYDSAGNLTNDGTQSFAFDAENKIKTVNGEADVYRYDADGNRVKKNFTSGEKLRMVYSGAQLIAEYDLANGALKKEYVHGAKGLVATIEPGNGTRYTTADHLGTPRVITSSTGAVISRHDYMPFGEEIGAGIGGRTTGMGFSVADGQRQKFTLKERDTETGLDYFLARYYSSTQGRFTSPDEFSGGPDELYNFAEDASDNPTFYADFTNPQSLNKYQYTYNNPVNMTDEDGHCPICAAVVEVAGTVVDVITTVRTLRDPDASTAEKVVTVVGTAAGLALPAGGYAFVGKAITKQLVKREAKREVKEAVAKTADNVVDTRAGKDFTKKGKQEVIEQNKRQNNGTTTCSNCGTQTVPGQQSKKGVPKPANETQVDHKTPKSRGGEG